jgi:Panthothenate synthetase
MTSVILIPYWKANSDPAISRVYAWRLKNFVDRATDKLYLGQKDYQQCMIITRLIQLMGLEEKVNIRICPILREKDGLAMSSRNMRLNKEERAKAPALYETLIFLKQNICNGSFEI